MMEERGTIAVREILKESDRKKETQRERIRKKRL